MTTQSEYALEEALIAQLKGMEYSFVRIDCETDMLANLKQQLEMHILAQPEHPFWINLNTYSDLT